MPICTCVPVTMVPPLPIRTLRGVYWAARAHPLESRSCLYPRVCGRLLLCALSLRSRADRALVVSPRLPLAVCAPRLPLSPASAWLPPSAWRVLKTETCPWRLYLGSCGVWGSRVERDPAPISEDPVCSAPPCSDPTGLTTPHLIISTDLGGPTAQVPQQGSLLALQVTSEAISASVLRLGLLLLNPKSFPNPRLEGVGWVAAGARGAGGDREAQPGK